MVNSKPLFLGMVFNTIRHGFLPLGFTMRIGILNKDCFKAKPNHRSVCSTYIVKILQTTKVSRSKTR